METERVIGVDLGGTKVAAGVVARDGTIERRLEAATPVDSQQALLTAIDDVVERLLDESVRALGLGIPSRLDYARGRALGSVNIPLGGIDIAARFRDRFRLPVGVENDGNAAALAEWRLGAGRGARTLVMLTLGTGVGGGLVLDGGLYRGWAEFGHLVIDVDGPPCQGSCSGRGHLEALVSGNAADRAAEEALGPGCEAEELVERARAGEDVAAKALWTIGELLGAGIGSLVNCFAPDVVVVGGGFGTGAGDLLLPPAFERARREALAPAGEALSIVQASLGTEAGLVGAGLVGFEALDGER